MFPGTGQNLKIYQALEFWGFSSMMRRAIFRPQECRTFPVLSRSKEIYVKLSFQNICKLKPTLSC